MRDYSKLSPQFWIDQQGKQIKHCGPITQLVALYLLSSPHSTMLGIYYLPIPFIAHELGIPLEGASKGINDLCEIKFCTYDPTSEYVWVHDMAISQLGKALKSNDNRVKYINELYHALPPLHFLKDFYDTYHSALCLGKKRDLTSPYPGPCKPLLSQEKEQEQDQEQEKEQYQEKDQEQDAGAPSHDGLPSSNTPKIPLLIIKNAEEDSSSEEINITVPLQGGEVFVVEATDVGDWKKAYPHIDVVQELRQLYAWNAANPTRRKTRSQIHRHIHAWLAREQRESLQRQQAPPCSDPMTRLAERGLSPTLAHNLVVGEQWLKQSRHTEQQKQDLLC